MLSAADGTLKSSNLMNSMIIPSFHWSTYIDTRMDAECVFDGILRNPLDYSQILPNSSFHNFPNEMRQKLDQSLGIEV